MVWLLAASGAEVDPTYNRYYEDFYIVVNGLDGYQRLLATSHGDVELVYFDNLRWDGDKLTRVTKPGGHERLDSFADYFDFLQRNIAMVAANVNSPQRRSRYRMLGTLSTGYDSNETGDMVSGAVGAVEHGWYCYPLDQGQAHRRRPAKVFSSGALKRACSTPSQQCKTTQAR